MKGQILTYALAFGGSAYALFNPYIGLLIYVAFAILKPEALWSWSLQEGSQFSRIVALSLLAGWAFKGFGRWQFGRARAVVAAFILFWLWCALSALGATDQAVAWRFVVDLAKVLLPFLVGITVIDSTARLKALAWVMVLCQGYLALEFNASYYDGSNRLMTVGFAGMEEGTVSISMVSGAGLAFFLGLSRSRWWLNATALGAGLLMVHVVFIGRSRGGILGLCVLGAVCLLFLSRRPTHYAVFAVALLLALRLAGPDVRDRFSTVLASGDERDFSAQSRLELWALCWELMLKHPLLGVGPDHFPLVVHEYGWNAGKEAHSLWMQAGAELGFPGLLFLASLYGVCAVRLWGLARGRVASHDPWLGQCARMTIASLAGFMVAVQFISAEGLELPYYTVLLGAAALRLASQPARDAARSMTATVPAAAMASGHHPDRPGGLENTR